MSSSVYAAIVGNGKTTRSNVEALIGDFSEAIDDLTLIIEMRDDISEPKAEAGAWVQQYAEAKNIKLHFASNVYTHIEVNLNPAIHEVKFFVLWDDDDLDCQVAAHYAQQNNIPMFDLTDGLVRIPTDQWAVEAPAETNMPESETSVKEEPEVEPEATFVPPPRESIFEAEQETILDWDEDEDDEEVEEMQGGELIEAALEEAGRLMARAFVEEMMSILRGENRDETE